MKGVEERKIGGRRTCLFYDTPEYSEIFVITQNMFISTKICHVEKKERKISNKP